MWRPKYKAAAIVALKYLLVIATACLLQFVPGPLSREFGGVFYAYRLAHPWSYVVLSGETETNGRFVVGLASGAIANALLLYILLVLGSRVLRRFKGNGD